MPGCLCFCRGFYSRLPLFWPSHVRCPVGGGGVEHSTGGVVSVLRLSTCSRNLLDKRYCTNVVPVRRGDSCVRHFAVVMLCFRTKFRRLMLCIARRLGTNDIGRWQVTLRAVEAQEVEVECLCSGVDH